MIFRRAAVVSLAVVYAVTIDGVLGARVLRRNSDELANAPGAQAGARKLSKGGKGGKGGSSSSSSMEAEARMADVETEEAVVVENPGTVEEDDTTDASTSPEEYDGWLVGEDLVNPDADGTVEEDTVEADWYPYPPDKPDGCYDGSVSVRNIRCRAAYEHHDDIAEKESKSRSCNDALKCTDKAKCLTFQYTEPEVPGKCPHQPYGRDNKYYDYACKAVDGKTTDGGYVFIVEGDLWYPQLMNVHPKTKDHITWFLDTLGVTYAENCDLTTSYRNKFVRVGDYIDIDIKGYRDDQVLTFMNFDFSGHLTMFAKWTVGCPYGDEYSIGDHFGNLKLKYFEERRMGLYGTVTPYVYIWFKYDVYNGCSDKDGPGEVVSLERTFCHGYCEEDELHCADISGVNPFSCVDKNGYLQDGCAFFNRDTTTIDEQGPIPHIEPRGTAGDTITFYDCMNKKAPVDLTTTKIEVTVDTMVKFPWTWLVASDNDNTRSFDLCPTKKYY
mmetsp:Transcript_30245/g.66505  ORF Transcript_30245/g.66505 Transcript_30245/m.66505 type:complete len:498 (+) Transcript_30245:223-1716(+)